MGSDRAAGGIVFIVLIEAAFSRSKGSKVLNKFDRLDPFDLFVSQFELIPEAQRGPMTLRQVIPIHLIGKNGLIMIHVFDLMSIVVKAMPFSRTVGKGVENRIPSVLLGLDHGHDVFQADSAPFCDARPTLNTVVRGDLLVFGHGANLGHGDLHGLVHKPAHIQAIVLKVLSVLLDNDIASIAAKSDGRIKVMSAAACAVSVPVPIAMLKSAAASAAASFMPSPIMRTFLP